MKYYHAMVFVLAASIAASHAGCGTSSRQLTEMDESQVNLRNIQSRTFDMTDRNRMLRTVIATLQDFGYVLDRADEELGVITATRLDEETHRITVTVRERGETQLLVRANMLRGENALSDRQIYQNFFTTLSKSVFLDAHLVE